MSPKEGFKRRKVKPNLKPVETTGRLDKTQEDEGRSGVAGDEEPVSPSAQMFHEPNFNVYVIAIMGCKTPVDLPVIKSNLVHTLLKHPRFSSLQVEDEKERGKLRWIPTNVDLEKHIIIPEIELGMDSPDQFVKDYVSNLSKTTISKTQPLWDIHILNVKTSDAEAVGVFRIHHSLGDGTSLMSLLLACTRQISDPEALPTIPVKKSKEKKDWRDYGRIWGWLFGVSWFLVLMLNTARFVYRTVSLEDIKMVKNAMNATVNDVALGVTQAGLSRYLNWRYAETKKSHRATEIGNNLPKKIRLKSTLLINLRPSVGIQALAAMMEKDTEVKWGNRIGYVLVPITIALHSNPLDYVREAKATIDRKKHSLEAIFTYSIAKVVLKIFGIKAASALSHRVITHTTMCFSNLVGPLDEIGFCGHPLAYIAPGCYGQPHGLMVNFQSYVNKMTFVLSVDEGTIPDPHRLCDDIVKALELTKDAVLEREQARGATSS
ncbi:wax ester synthase/diacylglycerol acyltransferase 11-like [Syzygium oleosum]|uniref:wax ester synthase/diacylglycerol acyltransferase 11-like n=1 Tax=Syzygium oleosum TaxID=219896 RepID=UPI0024BA8F51|nr:wax ester synthase/diacylglycerol acyltransferase 11-like [Syzygium oleosum]